MKVLSRCAIASLAVLVASPALAAEKLLEEDYDNPTFLATGVGVVSNGVGSNETATVGAWNSAGWAGTHYVNRTFGNPAAQTVVTLSGLQAGSAVKFGGILAFLESWDSFNGSCCAPDALDIFINGNLVATLTSNNAQGSIEEYAGSTELFDGIQANGNGFFTDTLVDFSTSTFANSAADASGNWSFGIQARGAGWQGGSDEAWGLDNWSVYGTIARQVGAVPEPATWSLMILGLGMIGGAMRRPKQVSSPAIA